MDLLLKLCADDREVLDLIDTTLKNQQHPRVCVDNVNEEHERPDGNSRQRAIRHLSSGQRAACGTEIEEQLAVEAKDRQRASDGDRKSPEARKSVQERIPEPIEPKPQARDRAAKLVGSNSRYAKGGRSRQFKWFLKWYLKL